ncbi:MAG: VanW family protein [Chloroflexota bacterium]
MATYSRSMPRNAPIFGQILAAFALGVGLFFALILAWTLGYQLRYAGRIFPGVTVAGVDLSGLEPAEAAVKLNQTLTFPISGRIAFRYADKVWVASPVELGMVLDPSASAQAAYRLGRSVNPIRALSDQLDSRQRGKDLAPVIIFDQRVAYAYVNNLAAQVNQPVMEATLRVEGTNVIAQPGQPGRTVDVDITLAVLSGTLQGFRDAEVPLAVREQQPLIMDVSSQADAARALLSQPLQIVVPNAQPGDPGPWVYTPDTLASILTVQRVDVNGQSEIRVGLEPGALAQMLTPISAQVDRLPKNARFYFDDPTGQLVLLPDGASTVGRTTDIAASIAAINDALLRGEHAVALVVNEVQPDVPDTATAESLGIREKIMEQTTYYYGSSSERRTNIRIASERFHGIFVAPGEVFSMGALMGDVTLDNGFAEAWIIYNGRTIKGVGGGVCQVSTTLFRAAFFAGFPVVQRVPHAYRVSYYERTAGGGRDPNLAGMDATVYFPLVDLQFVNDSPYWLLMETYYSDDHLTWKFYSTSDGRSVEWNTTGPTNIVPAPPPLFEVNPDLQPGQIKQVDWAADGADVTVNRTVRKSDGSIMYTDVFSTHYEPWQAICQFGPGTEDVEKKAKKNGLCLPP